ncbi:MAG: lysophospholipid acyltransferase family protein [Planctomycetota bacterium]
MNAPIAMFMAGWYHFWKSCAWLALFLLFRIRAFGVRNIPRTGGAIIASNHQSYLDPMILGSGLARRIYYMARGTLFHPPLISWYLHSVGAFPVRPGEGDREAFRNALGILAAGRVLVIFPEGHRSRDGNLLPMKSGVEVIAERAGVPVIPAWIHGAGKAWPKGRVFFRMRPVRVVYGPPIPVAGRARGEALAEIRAWMETTRAGLERKGGPE